MKCRVSFLFRGLAVSPLVLMLAGCGMIPDHMPKIPFVGHKEEAPAEPDPNVPYHMGDKMGYGHTLHFAAYSGVRDPKRLFKGSAMVNRNGVLHVPNVGDTAVGGMSASDAVLKIESLFHAKSGDGIILIQLERIENTPVVTVTGSVRKPGIYQWVEGMNAVVALPMAGGREGSPAARAVYVTRNGKRQLYTDGAPELQPGDIVFYSGEL